jgi:hypothetical protein
MKLTILINLSSGQQLTPEFFKDNIRSLPRMRTSVWQKTRLVGVQYARGRGAKLQLTLLTYRPAPCDASPFIRFSALRIQTSPNSNEGFLPSPKPVLNLSTKFFSFTAHPALAVLAPAQVAVLIRYSQGMQRLTLINRALLSFVLNSPRPHSTYATYSLVHLLPRRPHFVRFSLNNV